MACSNDFFTVEHTPLIARIRRNRFLCVVTTLVVMLQLAAVHVMASSEELHERCHDHPEEHGHECAVDLILSGGYQSVKPDIVPVDFIPEQPPVAVVFPKAGDSTPGHLAGGILAHAPPRGP
jgi:hypothetical protein